MKVDLRKYGVNGWRVPYQGAELANYGAQTPRRKMSMEVVQDEGISSKDVEERLSAFLKQKHIREGLSDDDYSRLKHFQKALESEEKNNNAESSLEAN